MQRARDREHHRHVASDDHALQPLCRSEETCKIGAATTKRANVQRTRGLNEMWKIGKLVNDWKTHLVDPKCEILGDRLTVGQRTLTPPVLVRIQVPQPPSRVSSGSLPELAKAS